MINPGLSPTTIVDRDSIAVDNWTNVPGSNVSGNGNVYDVYVVRTPDAGGSAPIGLYLSRSLDEGATWQPPQLVLSDPGVNMPTVVVGSYHDVYIFYYEGFDSGYDISYIVSHDDGATFSTVPTNVVFSTNTNDDGGVNVLDDVRSLAFPQVAVNPVDSDFYVTWSDYATPGQGPTVCLKVMNHLTDQWSATQAISAANNADINFDPVVAISPDGTEIGLSWYSQNVNTTAISRWAAVGTISDGDDITSTDTVTMTAPFEITPSPFLPYDGDYLGDCSSIIADADGFLVAFSYTNNTSGNNDIYVVRFRKP